jgi:hypothetical protein
VELYLWPPRLAAASAPPLGPPGCYSSCLAPSAVAEESPQLMRGPFFLRSSDRNLRHREVSPWMPHAPVTARS